MAVRPPDQIKTHPEQGIHAAALYSSKALQIEMKDIDRVAFVGVPETDLSTTVRDTVPGMNFKTESARYKKIKIELIIFNSGDTLHLEQRKSGFVPWADIVTVTGSEIVFDSLDGYYDPDRDIVCGNTIEGDSVTIQLDEIAYIRTMITDYVVPLTTMGGLFLIGLLLAL